MKTDAKLIVADPSEYISSGHLRSSMAPFRTTIFVMPATTPERLKEDMQALLDRYCELYAEHTDNTSH